MYKTNTGCIARTRLAFAKDGTQQQRDMRRAVRIVLEALDLGRHVDLLTLEVDDAVSLLVAAAAETHGDTAGIAASAGRVLAFGQSLDRLALVQRRTIDHHQLALAWRRGVECFQCHRRSPYSPVVTSMR